MSHSKVHTVLSEYKRGELHRGKRGPGKGAEVTSRKQAIAIALSEARKHGELKSYPPKRYDNPEHEIHLKKGMVGYWDKIQQKIIYK